MNPGRMNELVKRLTGIASKVYTATPCQETWSVEQIIREMFRAGTRANHEVVAGCLASLERDGLVKEPVHGRFIRIRIPVAFKEPAVANVPPPMPVPEPKPSLIAQLANVADKLRSVADDLDSIALDADHQLQNANTGSAKLTQLQGLLRELL